MTFDKDTILQFLHGNDQHQQADQAAQELPDQVDTEQHDGLLSKFGINPADLIAKLTGGGNASGSTGSTGGLGGLGGMIGKIL